MSSPFFPEVPGGAFDRFVGDGYGIPTEDGIRCPYHGWHFDAKGSCIDQPNEPPGSTLKNKIKTPA